MNGTSHQNGAGHQSETRLKKAPPALPPWGLGPKPAWADPPEDTDTTPATPEIEPPPKLGSLLTAALERVERRASGKEKPIALPWSVLEPHFGGGLWPGFHIINKGTGVGGTQFALQMALHAAKASTPALYIGLELGELDLALRVIGEEARVPWSAMWTGQAGPAYVKRAHEALPALEPLPIHVVESRPHGFSPSELRTAIEDMRKLYPEPDGPGSRPILVIIDFVQLMGDEPGDEQDLRIRIGRASYVCRHLANTMGIAVVGISSVARERYKLLNEIHTVASLQWELDTDGYPIERRIANTDAIVGAGKESGELEYSADSVSLIARVPETWNGNGCDVVFATAKGRATGAMWSPLHFTGFRYEECSDRGGRMVDAWKAAGERQERVREEKVAAKDEERSKKREADADAIRAYVRAHPNCSVRDARDIAVAGQHRRWHSAVELLGAELIQSRVGKQQLALTINDAGAPK